MRKRRPNTHPAILLYHYVQLRQEQRAYDGRTIPAGSVGRGGAVDVPAVRLVKAACGKRHETFACVDFWLNTPPGPEGSRTDIPSNFIARAAVYPCDVVPVCVLCAAHMHPVGEAMKCQSAGDFLPKGRGEQAERVELYDVAPWLLDKATRELYDTAREGMEA